MKATKPRVQRKLLKHGFWFSDSE